MNDDEYDIVLMRLTFRELRWSLKLTSPLQTLQDVLLWGQPRVWVCHFNQYIRLTATPSNLGRGNRPWMICPECDRRCQALWCRDDWGYAACRTCAKVKYASKHLKVRNFKEYMVDFLKRNDPDMRRQNPE